MDEELALETVYSAGNQMEAEVIRGLLESNDIPVLLQGETAGQVYGLFAGPLSDVKVLVRAEHADLARQLIQSV
jgi:hypothetical protein